MKNILRIFILTLLSVLVLSSCKKETKSPEQKYKGTWVLKAVNPIGDVTYINDSIDYKLKLSVDPEKNEFSTNFLNYKHEIKGTWKIINDTILLNYITPDI